MKIFLFILAIMFSSSASAAEVYECNAKTAGLIQCIALKQCECKLFPTSLMKNDPGGYRWDCGILRPQCIDQNKISDRENAEPYDGPSSVYIEQK
jgi:hypothetical protein